ncbi:tyrosine-type recombinase/integrase [Rhizobium leguminosarum]|uniref:tyrosine-type recombinase/integrase n=1 Tax=Rhizobium leguminosarum TaxID=384 RepID=UPI00102FA6F4|nr:site-specific integrase [Rhizobium leguminosarum]NZD54138.1 tyrosine-type recombinase/integrase [Rhizobium leguminosarum]TAY98597.1 site-specific integrase [Rhizobium leguminosarum]TAZ09362.1 site-specific integrase [Rhizobium leguminosarum]
MAKALTVRAIEAFKATDIRQEIPDGGLPGLYLIIQPSGVVSWAIRYRFEGKPKKFTIGPLPLFPLAKAREEASKLLRDVSEGKDPAAAKATKKALKLDIVNDALDEFIKRYVEKKNRPSTITERKRLFDKDVRPKFGKRTMKSIKRHEIVAHLDEVAERAPIVANRLLSLLRKFFNWAVQRDIIDMSPMEKKIDRPSEETTRDRILTDDEVRLLWLASGNIGYPFGPMVRLLLLTAQRRSEVSGARWWEMELAGNDQQWIIPPERSKNRKEHFVALAAETLREIEALPKIRPAEDEEPIFLFTTTGVTKVSGYGRAKKNIDAEMLKIAREDAEVLGQSPAKVELDPWTFHDLRRTAASGMARLGVPVHVVEAVINHRSGSIKGVAAVYNRYDYAEEKRAALIAWADHVKQVIGGP